jgi:acetyl esterase/lipase
LERDFVVVSIDHRLAPETKLPGVIGDIHSAWAWVVENGSKLFGIDTTRMAMAGGSSGAYLALISGYAIHPRPRALASFWGFGDITAPWEAQPSAFYRQSPIVSKEQADRSVGVVALSEPPPDVDRAYSYLYCRQQGRWLIEVTGHDLPKTQDGSTPTVQYVTLRQITRRRSSFMALWIRMCRTKSQRTLRGASNSLAQNMNSFRWKVLGMDSRGRDLKKPNKSTSLLLYS